MTKEDIVALAELSRIRLTDAEIERFSSEIEAVLGYVARVKDLAQKVEGDTQEVGPLFNVFRDDVVTTKPGTYTESLLRAAPLSRGLYVEVKKILGD